MAMSDEEIAQCRFATENAKKVLKEGDRIRVGRCGGMHATYTFSHWDGNWAVSKSGIDDLSARSITKLNGKAVDFTGQGKNPDEKGSVRHCLCNSCGNSTPRSNKSKTNPVGVTTCTHCFICFVPTHSFLVA